MMRSSRIGCVSAVAAFGSYSSFNFHRNLNGPNSPGFCIVCNGDARIVLDRCAPLRVVAAGRPFDTAASLCVEKGRCHCRARRRRSVRANLCSHHRSSCAVDVARAGRLAAPKQYSIPSIGADVDAAVGDRQTTEVIPRCDLIAARPELVAGFTVERVQHRVRRFLNASLPIRRRAPARPIAASCFLRCRRRRPRRWRSPADPPCTCRERSTQESASAFRS